MDFVIWKFIHIVAVILFLGNIATGFYWQFHGEKQNNHHTLLTVFEGLHKSDLWITNPCIVLIIVSGLGMGYSVGFELLFQGWILVAYLLMVVSGAAYAFRLVPLHTKIIEVLNVEAFGEADWQAYRNIKQTWFFWAAIASILPFMVLFLMYFKPVF